MINLVNLCMMIFGSFFMFLPNPEEITFMGIGFFVVSVLNIVFNNLD
jgi:hypothetical protein